jgi:ribokinase
MSVTVVGSINYDVVALVGKYPEKGETIFGEKIEYFNGGKGANQATSVARLGGLVNMIGAVGTDLYGDILIEGLKKNNIVTDYVKRSTRKSTGITIVTIDQTAENTMQVFKGANDDLTDEDVVDAMNEITGSNVLLVQMEVPQQTVITSMKLAKQKGMYVVLDPAPADGIVIQALEYADVITPNQQETMHLVGINVKDVSSALKAAETFKAMGVSNSIIKMGSKGSVVYEDGEWEFIESVKVAPVDTVGAGDSFAGAIALGVSQGKSIIESAKLANIVGAISVTKFGAQAGIPTMKEVQEFIKENNLGNLKDIEEQDFFNGQEV